MLETVDLTKTLTPEEYRVKLIKLQVRLAQLGFQVYKQQRPVILCFEGWDAAGKGGAIRRLTERPGRPKEGAAWHVLDAAPEARNHCSERCSRVHSD